MTFCVFSCFLKLFIKKGSGATCKRFFVFVAVFSLLFSNVVFTSVVRAEEMSGMRERDYYISITGGYALGGTTNVDLHTNLETFPTAITAATWTDANTTGKIKRTNSASLAVAFGRMFDSLSNGNSSTALELQGFFIPSTNVKRDCDSGQQYKILTYGGLINGSLAFDMGMIMPRIGVGIGYGGDKIDPTGVVYTNSSACSNWAMNSTTYPTIPYTSTKAPASFPASQAQPDYDAILQSSTTKGGFYYNAFAGLDFMLSDSMALELSYKWLATFKSNTFNGVTALQNASGTFDTTVMTPGGAIPSVKYHYDFNNFLATLKFFI